MGQASLLAALLFLLPSCKDSFGRLNGCEVTFQIGQWFTDQEGSFTYDPSFGSSQRCPIPLVQPGENVLATGFVTGVKTFTDDVVPTEEARLQVRNSAGVKVGDKVFGFRRESISLIETALDLQYPAATGGYQNFNETDDLELSIFSGCCLVSPVQAEIRMALNYFPTPYPNVVLEGSSIPLSATTQTWKANSNTGGLPHTFSWYRNGSWVASGETYTAATGTSPFDLRVDMTNVYGQVASSSLHVDVDGLFVEWTGPTRVFASEPDQWSVAVQGGYPPYTIRWYRNTTYVASGATYSMITGATSFSLRADIVDSHGKAYTLSRYITVQSTSTCTTSMC